MEKSKKYDIFISPAAAGIILCVIYIIKGVYPFGSANISYYDMNQSFIPLYTHVWDVLHGSAAAYYSWFTACSSNTYANIGAFVFSPFNLFFLFVRRNDILNSMPLFLMLKIMLMSFTMSLYLKKSYKTGAAVNTAAALLYSYSGYVLQYYTNIYFLDAVIFFPLIMLSCNKMLKTGRGAAYMLIMALSLISCPYISMLILIYIVFYSFGKIHITGTKKDVAAALGVYTLLALCISMFVFLPSLVKWSASGRISVVETPNYLGIITSAASVDNGIKHFMLFGSESAAAVFLTALFTFKKRALKIKKLKLYFYLFVITVFPMLVPASEMLWHFGSHVDFPYRFGFIISFTAADMLVWYIKRVRLFCTSNKAAPIFIVCAVSLIFVFSRGFKTYGIYAADAYALYPVCFAALAAAYAAVLCTGKKSLKYAFLSILAVLSCIAAGMGFIAPGGYFGDEADASTVTGDGFIIKSTAIRDEAYFKNDNISRIKCVYPMLSTNYPLVMERPGIGGWTNENSAEYFNEMRALGYGRTFTRILDNGGTAFTDAFLNIKKVLSNVPLNDSLYTPEQTIGDITVYDCKYKLPFGIRTGETLVNCDISGGFDAQNRLFDALTESDKVLFYAVDKSSAKTVKAADDLYIHTFDMQIKGKLTIYADITAGTRFSYGFAVNGSVKNFGYFENTAQDYPQKYNNGYLELGTYENEDISLSIATADPVLSDIEIGVMDNAALDALVKSFADKGAYNVNVKKDKINMTINSVQGEYAFLPVEYSPDWAADINGRDTKIYPVLGGAFMAVPLENGENTVQLKYRPALIKIGLSFSLMGAVLACLILYLKKYKSIDIVGNKLLGRIAYYVFGLTAILFIAVIYIIPLIAFLMQA